jgi:murein L,D-transpeptidase YafK
MKILKVAVFCFAIILMSITLYYFFPEKKLNTSKSIDKIIVLKSKRKLLVLNENQILKEYKISIGKMPIGAKRFEGDFKTPEGIYTIESKNPHSGYFKNLGISYPNEKDAMFAKESGKKPGGLIKIHGLKNGMGYIGKFHRWKDWTNGCIALTNQEMEELYLNVKVGTVIEIKP